MRIWAALLMLLATPASAAEPVAFSSGAFPSVTFPGPDGVTLRARLFLPGGPAKAPAIVALHGCGGPAPARDEQWGRLLSGLGHIVLMPDSFGSRGLGPQCRNTERQVTASGLRRSDAIAAAEWLAARPGTPAGGVALVGWSNGGGTVIWTARLRADLPGGLFRAFVAFYPGCGTASRADDYQPAAPMLILVGESDDWTPAEPCRRFAGRFPGLVSLKVYPGAYHDFDAPGLKLQERSGLATPPGGTGRAHVGSDPAAREDALRLVPEFLEGTAPR